MTDLIYVLCGSVEPLRVICTKRLLYSNAALVSTHLFALAAVSFVGRSSVRNLRVQITITFWL